MCFSDCDQNPAFCRAIKLGHDDPGHICGVPEGFDLAQGVLPDRRIEDEDDIMRGVGVEFAGHPNDFGQLCHQFGLIL